MDEGRDDVKFSFNIIDSIIQKPKKFSCKEALGHYMFFLWDGLAFFGFDDTKLARIKTGKAKFTDKLTSKKYVTILGATLLVAIWLIVVEVSRFG